MTELIEYFKNMPITRDGYTAYRVNVAAIRDVIGVLKKCEKYRWHDLRKEPSDVPKHNERVLCLTNKTDEQFRYCIVSKGCDYWNKYVIAWKELERFEVEE